MSDILSQILNQWANAGYSVGPIVNDGPRTRTYRLERDRVRYFAKINLSGEAVVIENDVWWSNTLYRASDGDKDLVRAPHMHEQGPGWYIAEWIEAPLLLPGTFNLGDELAAAAVQPMVKILQWLDGRMHITLTGRSLYDDSDTARYSDLLRKVDGWLERPLAEGRISASEVTTAKDLIDRHHATIKPAFQHGDLVPWYVFCEDDGRYIVVNAEHASLMKPQYYDLAYAYSRLYTRSAAPETARKILVGYLAGQKLPRAEFWAAFLPVITLRALGMQADALADREQYDYLPAARDLLERSLRVWCANSTNLTARMA